MIEKLLSDSTFLHGCNLVYTKQSKPQNIPTHKDIKLLETFEGIQMDTCANRLSAMSENQYKAYDKALGLPNGSTQ